MDRNMWATERQDQRRKDFKSHGPSSAEDWRRKREETSLRLRKESRDNSLLSKRRAFHTGQEEEEEEPAVVRQADRIATDPANFSTARARVRILFSLSFLFYFVLFIHLFIHFLLFKGYIYIYIYICFIL